MKKKVLIWEITGFLVVCALSGVFHFIYDWSGKQTWIGFFCPVNESTWEHLKLLFFPVLIFSAIEYIWIRKESKNFIAARGTGTVLGMFTIIAVFYTYTGILGNHYLWLDLVTFFIGALVTFLYTNYGMKRYREKTSTTIMAIVVFILFFAAFVIFTYYPPHIGLFRDPISTKFGIID